MATTDSLLRSLELVDSSLGLARQKLDSSLTASFTGADARLSPARLLRRLSTLQAELPELQKIATDNAEAR